MSVCSWLYMCVLMSIVCVCVYLYLRKCVHVSVYVFMSLGVYMQQFVHVCLFIYSTHCCAYGIGSFCQLLAGNFFFNSNEIK